MKRAFDGDLNILDSAEEKLSELDDKLIETSQTEAQKTHTQKLNPRTFKICRTIWKGVAHMLLKY